MPGTASSRRSCITLNCSSATYCQICSSSWALAGLTHLYALRRRMFSSDWETLLRNWSCFLRYSGHKLFSWARCGIWDNLGFCSSNFLISIRRVPEEALCHSSASSLGSGCSSSSQPNFKGSLSSSSLSLDSLAGSRSVSSGYSAWCARAKAASAHSAGRSTVGRSTPSRIATE
jgi:hypothetical protein